MKIKAAFFKGFKGGLGSWKGILVIWLTSFVFLELVKVPLRGVLNSGLGLSMATERLAESVDLEILTDLGVTQLQNIVFSMVRSTSIAWLFSFLLNIFLSGGIFDYLKDISAKFSFTSFFSASASNFKSFFIIKILSGLIMSALFSIIYLFVALFNLSDSVGAKLIFIVIAMILFLVFLMILAVTDFARAKRVTDSGLKGTKALNYGFKTAFSNIFNTLGAVATVTIIQLAVVILAFQYIIRWVPQNGFSVFILFVASQLLYYTNVFFKIWRFGAVTHLMGEFSVKSRFRQKSVFQEPRIKDDIIE